VAKKLNALRTELGSLDFGDTAAFVGLLERVRGAIAETVPTPELVREMEAAFAAEALPWPVAGAYTRPHHRST